MHGRHCSFASARADYAREGYVVLRGLIPAAACDRAREAFAREVKPYQGLIYRQASASPERHVLSGSGFVLNSLLNVHDLRRAVFPAFRAAGIALLTHEKLRAAVENLLGEPATLVQSMYFEGNPSTWAHQDTYYLDSTRLGAMTAAWIALEDIAPGAGRFFVYPKSHLVDVAKNGGDFDIAFHHDRYQRLVLELMAKYGLERHAPPLDQGDVLLWSSRTVHGSLETTDPARSRSSVTAHYIPRSTELLQFQTRRRRMNLEMVGGMALHHAKDQDLSRHRLELELQARFPKLWQLAKRVAIKLVTR